MSDLSKQEVLSALAAGEFSAAFALHLDVLVTLDFGRMGISGAEEAKAELNRFLKAANSWLAERRLPVAWIACIEGSRGGDLHAHIAMHVPGMRKDGTELRGIRYRSQFRQWARDAVARHIGEPVPRAVNVRCSLVPSVISHWISVTYLLKGFDRSALLVGARNSPDGEELLLGDILPFAYRDPGDVRLDRRLFISGNLGPARRRKGAPPMAQCLLPMNPNPLNLAVLRNEATPYGRRFPDFVQGSAFRASVEDGAFDIRRIYGKEFAAFVTREAPERTDFTNGGQSEQHLDLLSFLDGLEI